MSQISVLQEWSQARSSLSASLAPRAVSIVCGKHRAISGFHWRPDLIVTAAEALGGDEEVGVLSAAGEQRARVLACDLTTDVAVLQVPGSAEPASASVSSTPLQAGAGVVFVGRSRGGPLVSFGSVRLAGPAWSSRRGGTIDQRLEFEGQLDVRFEGALVADFAGAAQAMLVAGPRGSLLGIPSATIERIASVVEQRGYLPRPYLGLRLQHLWLDEATRTRWGRARRTVAAVAGVESGSPAERAGLAPGDLIEALDGAPVADIEALAARLAGASPGRTLALLRRRGGQTESIAIEVGEWRPAKA
ncbi:MAG TPA: S1C family serine protease [Steroidobacteraceae bacterium]|jgi:S1-C subfamily serine protease|nr:S1C family serine protease [Steroidobacteraceae bacterium]